MPSLFISEGCIAIRPLSPVRGEPVDKPTVRPEALEGGGWFPQDRPVEPRISHSPAGAGIIE